MKLLKFTLLIGLIGFFACENTEKIAQVNLLETPCNSEMVFIDSDRLSQISLTPNQIPATIRAFIAAEFPGRTVMSAREFVTKDRQNFTEVRLDLVGYLLFDDTETYRCVNSTTETDNTVSLIEVSESGSCSDNLVSFKFQVHPILVSNCAQSGCHNSKDKAEDISVETYEEVMKEIRPGNADRSEHYKSITEDPNDDDIMPERPRDPLLASEIKIIGDWINQGAGNTDCSVPCDATATSFKVNIQPLFKTYCYGCHQANDQQGNVSMEDYEHILEYVRDGSLLGSMKHERDYDAMPLYLDKMTDCQIALVENWITEGALNN